MKINTSIKYCLYLSFLLLFSNCQKDSSIFEMDSVQHKGAQMPIVVRGNTKSEVYVLFLHGGPGGSSLMNIFNYSFAGIEEDFAMVYYDQRSTINSQADGTTNLLTLQQFEEDLDIIINSIKRIYEPQHLFLMGHSWGGTLGTAYLLKPENQNKIDGWISIDGGHNLGPHAFELSRDFVLSVADSLISSGQLSVVNENYWNDAIRFYKGLTSWQEPEIFLQHCNYVNEAKGYEYALNKKNKSIALNQIIFPAARFLPSMLQDKEVIKNMDVWYHDFTSQLSSINIPTLILWGKHDGILPVQLAIEAIKEMNLNDSDFYIFQKSAHSPHYEETELFNQIVLNFIHNNI